MSEKLYMDILCVQIPFTTESQFKKASYTSYFDYPLITISDSFRILALFLKPCPTIKLIIYPYY